MVVGEARIAYRGSARFDDEIDLVVRAPSFGTTSMTTELGVERADGAVLTEGELRHVFVDLDTFEKRPVPAEVREALAA
jgi:acyl-CoA thioester hydrolase